MWSSSFDIEPMLTLWTRTARWALCVKIQLIATAKTALHKAAKHGHVDILVSLLLAGARVDMKDKMWWTPLLWSAASGHVYVSWLLLQNAADVRARGYDGQVEAGHYNPEATERVQTALHLACASGHDDVAQVLLKKRAPVNVVDMHKQVGDASSSLSLQSVLVTPAQSSAGRPRGCRRSLAPGWSRSAGQRRRWPSTRRKLCASSRCFRLHRTLSKKSWLPVR